MLCIHGIDILNPTSVEVANPFIFKLFNAIGLFCHKKTSVVTMVTFYFMYFHKLVRKIALKKG